jgi:3-oxoacyl-[acyl-carrier-protein] synthase II
MSTDAVVITGAAAISPLGHTARETWEALLAGRSGIRPIRGFEAGGFSCQAAAMVEGAEAAGVDAYPRWARISDLHSHLLLRCAREAFAESRLGTASIPGEDLGCYLGIGMIDYRVEELLPAVLASRDTDGALEMAAFFSGGYQEIHPLWLLSKLNNIALCQVAIELELCGENAVFSPGAEAGAQAILEGAEAIREGRARAVLAGGVSEKVCPGALARAHLQGVLDTVPGGNGAACRPFAAYRGGTILGEGCALLCLERRTSADERGVPYVACVAGHGSAFGAAPGSRGAAAQAIAGAMREALRRAGITPPDVDVLIAHGDGTEGGDAQEIEAIHQVFAACLDRVRVFASKGALGHLQAAGPPLDAVLGMCMLRTGTIPPTLQPAPVDPRVGFPLVTGRPLQASPRHVMVNGRGHAGQCASLILRSLP